MVGRIVRRGMGTRRARRKGRHDLTDRFHPLPRPPHRPTTTLTPLATCSSLPCAPSLPAPITSSRYRSGRLPSENGSRNASTWNTASLPTTTFAGDGDRSDTFGRVFARLDAKIFAECFQQWTKTVAKRAAGDVLAIDGKEVRHSFDTATGQGALHLVSAWSCRERIVSVSFLNRRRCAASPTR